MFITDIWYEIVLTSRAMEDNVAEESRISNFNGYRILDFNED